MFFVYSFRLLDFVPMTSFSRWGTIFTETDLLSASGDQISGDHVSFSSLRDMLRPLS